MQYQINDELYTVHDPFAVPRVGDTVFVTDLWYVVQAVEWYVDVIDHVEVAMTGTVVQMARVILKEAD